jgi:hypothetical protein
MSRWQRHTQAAGSVEIMTFVFSTKFWKSAKKAVA